MALINLREFYPWYTWDEFVEVPDVVAGELFADRRYQKTHERKMRYHKVHSLDAEDGTEEIASIKISSSPEVLLEIKEQHCQLCQAINSLPEIQGKRIEAHYLRGLSQVQIAKNEGVTKGSVNNSITRGLAAMKIKINNSEIQPYYCP